MASNRTTDKVTGDEAATQTEAKPFSFSRLINRNGHEKATPPPPPVKGPPKTVWREYFESAVVTVVMALFGMTFIVQAVKVPTGSMQNTITIGDHLLVNKFIFAPGISLPFLPQREIQRGDIIVFKYPGNKYDPDSDRGPDNTPILTNYVKRVIGLPGDRIRIDGKDVIVNGEVLPEHRIVVAREVNDKAELKELSAPSQRAPNEPYDVYHNVEPHNDPGERNVFEDQDEIVVPPASYFVMGDNRDNSQDSRFWGFVPRDLVIGRAMFVYWSYDESAPATGWGFVADFFKNTRWTRTGTLVK
ncbi:MAG TPA: signal peptidase I [Pyrinomonadaceae bacterium]|nr:signal peptidase I [Pyrinomonadaceae bacterium]